MGAADLEADAEAFFEALGYAGGHLLVARQPRAHEPHQRADADQQDCSDADEPASEGVLHRLNLARKGDCGCQPPSL
jgi:hypothetical protein